MTRTEACDKMLNFVGAVAEDKVAERGSYADTAKWLLEQMAVQHAPLSIERLSRVELEDEIARLTKSLASWKA